MLVYLQTLLVAAFTLLGLSGGAPTPHHTWLPLSEWGQSEPAVSSWDYLGFGNAYPLQPRVDTHASWLPQPVATPTIEIVRSYRKPSVDPSAWAQIPVIGGGRDTNRLFVALVPRGFEDFVLVRKPFIIVEETVDDSKDKKKDKKGSKEDKKPEDDKDSTDESDDSTKAPEPSSTTKRPSTTTRSTSPTTSTSTTPSTTPADDAENAAAADNDSQPDQTRNNPQK